MSQLLVGWTGLCSLRTPLRFLINHPDTLTWDLSSRSALTVNYSLSEGRVWEAEVLHRHWPDLITHLQMNENTAAGVLFVLPVFDELEWILTSRRWEYEYSFSSVQFLTWENSGDWLVYIGWTWVGLSKIINLELSQPWLILGRVHTYAGIFELLFFFSMCFGLLSTTKCS